jgi:transketolase
MPCRLLFEKQDDAYKKSVLGTTLARVAVEAAVELGWERYIGFDGKFVGMHDFGESGKSTTCMPSSISPRKQSCAQHVKCSASITG